MEPNVIQKNYVDYDFLNKIAFLLIFGTPTLVMFCGEYIIHSSSSSGLGVSLRVCVTLFSFNLDLPEEILRYN